MHGRRWSEGVNRSAVIQLLPCTVLSSFAYCRRRYPRRTGVQRTHGSLLPTRPSCDRQPAVALSGCSAVNPICGVAPMTAQLTRHCIERIYSSSSNDLGHPPTRPSIRDVEASCDGVRGQAKSGYRPTHRFVPVGFHTASIRDARCVSNCMRAWIDPSLGQSVWSLGS